MNRKEKICKTAEYYGIDGIAFQSRGTFNFFMNSLDSYIKMLQKCYADEDYDVEIDYAEFDSRADMLKLQISSIEVILEQVMYLTDFDSSDIEKYIDEELDGHIKEIE